MSGRRWIRMGVVCLVLGAVVNVLVAWGCAVFSRGRGTASMYTGPSFISQIRPEVVQTRSEVFQNLPKEWRPLKGSWMVADGVFSGIGVECTVAGITTGDPTQGFLIQEVFDYQEGWPLVALRAVWRREQQPGNANPAHPIGFASGYEVPRGSGPPPMSLMYGGPTPRVLAFVPIWPGFVLNTLTYSAVLAILAVVLAWIRDWRARRRAARGFCTRCSYDLRGRSGGAACCPECGAEQKAMA